MKKQYKFVEIFFSSLKILEKNRINIPNFKNNLKNIKFKILYNANTKSVKNVHTSNINNRDLIKLIYLINFEETFEPNSLSRTSFSLLTLLNENIDLFTNNIWPDNKAFRQIYNQTMSINILYTIYKIKNLDE